MQITAQEILSKLHGFHHLMEVNVENIDYEISEDEEEPDDDADPENPGFVKGWVHFLM